MYRTVVSRMDAGEDYYAIVGDELRTRGYAPRPFFNWRLPTLAWFLSAMPRPEWGWVILGLLILATLGMWIASLRREGDWRAATVGGALVFLALCGFLGPGVYYFHEPWAATLIALSLAARARDCLKTSLAAALVAVSIREHSLAFVSVMGLVALLERRKLETVLWVAVALAFFLYLGIHAHIVSARLLPDDPMNNWSSLGGWLFVLRTAVWSGLFNVAPLWVIALVLPSCFAGLAHWKSPLGNRVALTVGAYALAFLVIGRPDNTYWGVMYAPILTLGFLHTYHALTCLWRGAHAAET